MKIQITRSTVADGNDVAAGDVCEVSNETGTLLIRMGKAVPHKRGTVETADAKHAPETADSTPHKPGRGK